MKVNVKLFAVARQRAGAGAVEIELSPPATVGQLRRALVEQCSVLADVVGHARLAVNNEYADDNTIVMPGSEIAIIPPVSGG